MSTARAPRLQPAVSVLLIAIVAFVAATLLDRLAWESLADPRVYERDWGRLLRVMGYLPTWILAAGALMLHDGGDATRTRWRRGGLLLGSATLGGLAAELLKLLLRRERPRLTGGEYNFRPFTEGPFDAGGLGLPSSHALVAFAAAAMLSRLFPRATPVWWLLAVGCAITRVMHGAHFLSDVTLAAIVAWVVAALLWSWKGDPPRTVGSARGS